jgi:hypothetical protein
MAQKLPEPLHGKDTFFFPFYPDMPFFTFSDRLRRYTTKCSDSVQVTAVLFLQRYMNVTKETLHRANVHYAYTVAFLIAMKVLEDNPYSNKHFSEIAGVPVNVLNNFERLFLSRIDFDLKIEPDVLKKIKQTLN